MDIKNKLTSEEIETKVNTLVEKFEEKLPHGDTVQLFLDNLTQQDQTAYALCVFANGVQMVDKFNVRVTHSNEVWWC